MPVVIAANTCCMPFRVQALHDVPELCKDCPAIPNTLSKLLVLIGMLGTFQRNSLTSVTSVLVV